MTYDAVIIGGGHNGLTAATYLARAGQSVLVVERQPEVGGACITEELFPGFFINTASYTLGMLQPEIVDELELGKYGFESYVRDPQFMAPMPDGRYLVVYPDAERTLREVAKFSEDDAEAMERFERDAGRVGDVLRRYFLRPPTDWTWGDIAAEFKTPEEQGLWQRFVMGSLVDLVHYYFESEAIRGTIVYSLAGNDIGPDMPGSAFLKTYHTGGRIGDALGCFGYIRGGMGSLSKALAAAFRDHGGEIRTNTTVRRVIVEGGRATGVELEDGERIMAKRIISNADPKTTLGSLAGAEHVPAETLRALDGYKQDGTTWKLNAALDALPVFSCLPPGDQSEYIRGGVVISPSTEHLRTAYREYAAGGWSRRPFVLCHFQSITDPQLAPPGKHTMTLCGDWAPYQPADGPWDSTKRQAIADDILDTVQEYAPNLREVIRDYQLLLPPDIEARFGIRGGHVLHGGHTLPQYFSLRPTAELADHRTPVENLYLCGAGTHPGGYVSCAPGHNAAQVILQDAAGG